MTARAAVMSDKGKMVNGEGITWMVASSEMRWVKGRRARAKMQIDKTRNPNSRSR